MPIDHFGNTSATFPNRYWINSTYYKPGGPVFCTFIIVLLKLKLLCNHDLTHLNKYSIRESKMRNLFYRTTYKFSHYPIPVLSMNLLTQHIGISWLISDYAAR